MTLSRRQSGFTLVELMIAITLSLIILGALSVMFVTSSRARDEITRANQQIENGRYAMQVLADDLRQAGYYGGFDPRPLVTPALPDPCATATATLKTSLALHVQGFNDGANPDNHCGGATLPTLTNYKAGTDAVVIRRVSSCRAGVDSDCDQLTAQLYFQASHCRTQLTEAKASGVQDGNGYLLESSSNAGAFTTAPTMRTTRNCTTAAPLRRLLTHIYYIDSGTYTDAEGRTVPTLVRAELRGGNFSTRTPIAEGIEELELRYRNGAGAYVTPTDAAGWRAVEVAEVSLLARSTDPSPGHTDSKTYVLGADSFTPGGSYKRHAFQTTVHLSNPAGLY